MAGKNTAAAPAASKELEVVMTLQKETKGTVVYGSESIPTVYIPKPLLNGARPQQVVIKVTVTPQA